ncbi:MAG TPA: glycosyltransferase family 4 protein [Thermomicrobiales bacterium]|nr:glycosyltransferase family 4 protein [Thermomicrobiales bacterium]
MKLLIVTPHLPAPPDSGGARRMFELIRHLAARQGHEVVTLSLAGPDEDVALNERELGRVVAVRVPATARMPPSAAKRRTQLRSLVSRRSFHHYFYRRPALQRRLSQLLAAERFDLVQFEYSAMGGYAAPGVPTVLDVVDIEHDVLGQQAREGSAARRLFNAIEARKFAAEERAAWHAATLCLATSEPDARRVAAATGGRVEVIPNGVDTGYFQRRPLAGTDPRDLLFVGALRYRPNAEAVLFFVEQVMPLLRRAIPGVSLTVVGVDPPPQITALDQGAQGDVHIAGAVPDVRPYLAAGGTVVVPLHVGGGTRLKILEAFAAGRPVISTRLGAAGLTVRDGEQLLFAEEPAAFVAALQHLIDEPALRDRLAESGHALVRAHYEWSAIARRLADCYTELPVPARQPMR